MKLIRFIKSHIWPKTVLYTEVKVSNPSQKLKDRNIIVTGGGRGLGFYIAKKCSEEGANVIITGRSETTLKSAANAITKCKYILYDSMDIDHIHEFLDNCEDMFKGPIDTIINNAAISLHESDFSKVTFESWETQFITNLKSPFFLSKEFAKRAITKRINGNIIFITSERGLYDCDDIPYGLIKSAINSLTHGLGRRLLQYGIRVNAVAPGVTASDMTGYNRDSNLYREKSCSKRVYLPDEVAETVVFLISDTSACISSQIIACNNGNNFKCPW